MYYIWIMKKCSKCHLEKELSEFHKRTNRPCGVRSICKECYKEYPKNKKARNGYDREYDLMKSYKITPDKFSEILKLQNNCCAICGKNQDMLVGHKKYLCVDHCHVSGKVRGLLCDSCNRALGLFKDSEIMLTKAIEYVKMYS